MDWRVTTVARSSLVTRCALTWSSADLALGASCSNFTSSTRSTVQCGVDGGEIGVADSWCAGDGSGPACTRYEFAGVFV